MRQSDNHSDQPRGPEEAGVSKPPSEAARRALAEAQRRRARNADSAAQPPEIDGRGGLEPVRYGDWEVKGLATDF